MLQFSCPACQSPLRLANDSLAGKKVRCPKCGAVVTVPAPEPGPAPAIPNLELPEPEAPPAPVGAVDLTPAQPIPVQPLDEDPPPRPHADEGPPRRRRDPDEGPPRRRHYDDEPPPRRRRRERTGGGGNSLLWILLGVGGGLVVLCGGMIVVIVIVINQGVNAARQAEQARQDREKEALTDQWERGRAYEVPPGGLVLKSRLTTTDERFSLPGRPTLHYRKVFLVRMNAGSQYTIRMNDRDVSGRRDRVTLDPVLVVEDDTGLQLAFNDDAPGEGTLNSRIDFFPPRTGVFRVITTNLNPNSVGVFTLSVTKQ
jgi:predicted Zn finger-like uncharacterized protein